MIVDLPSTLVFIGVSGYTSFRSYTYFQNSQFNSVNGEKLVFKCLLYGTLNASAYLLILSMLGIDFKPDADKKEISIALWQQATLLIGYQTLSLLTGFITSNVYRRMIKENDLFQKELVYPIPEHSNFLEEILIHLHKANDTTDKDKNNTLAFIELRTGKIYTGLLKKFDLNDDMPICERFVSIVPLQSGWRDTSGNVKFYTNYLEVAIDRVIVANPELTEIKKIQILAIDSIKPVIFPQSEIITIREYDESAAIGFGLIPSPDTTDESAETVTV